MWLITILIAAIIVTALHFRAGNLKKYKLDFLALMLWGTFIMVLIDHSIAYMNDGGNFLEMTTSGLITNGILLGIAMLVPIVLIWAVVAFTPIGEKIRLS
ncbi:MAG: hypothetical protein ABH863_03250 [Candidatus Micrarchaeota archaeon]